MEKAAKKDSKKWTFGGLFRRRKKDMDSDSSSDNDRKAGFVSPRNKSRRELKNGRYQSKDINSPENYRELYTGGFEARIPTPEYNKFGSLDRKNRRKSKGGTIRVSQDKSSSEEDSHSLVSSTVSQFKSDECLAQTNRRSRAARTERYLKRMGNNNNNSKTSPSWEIQEAYRWKTQPIQMTYQHDNAADMPMNRTLRNSSSLSNVHSLAQTHPACPMVRPTPIAMRPMKTPPLVPPPIPPRDPERRILLHCPTEQRPVSYAFDKSIDPTKNWLQDRCVSDDKLYATNQIQRPQPIVQPTPQRPASVQPKMEHQLAYKFDNEKNTAPQYKYIADAVPRSRRPIHIFQEPHSNKLSTIPQLEVKIPTSNNCDAPKLRSASDFWRKLDQQEVQRRGRPIEQVASTVSKPRTRSSSSSRVADLRMHRDNNDEQLMNKQNNHRSTYENSHVVDGCLFLRPNLQTKNIMASTVVMADNNQSSPYSVETKSRSMPGYYAEQKIAARPANGYEEHIAKKKQQSVYHPPEPPLRSISIQNGVGPDAKREEALKKEKSREKSTNLEQAINELEAIYQSLKLGDEELLDRAERRDVPTPTPYRQPPKDFEYDNDEEDEPCGEPDIVLDDVAYRTIKHANKTPQIIDQQPPFGIPIRPTPHQAGSDYLNAMPTKKRISPHKYPDVVVDDLAVRNLRKDNLDGSNKATPLSPQYDNGMRRRKATRSYSENIYNLIHKGASRPSGGNWDDYYALDQLLNGEKKEEEMPSTLYLLDKSAKDINDNLSSVIKASRENLNRLTKDTEKTIRVVNDLSNNNDKSSSVFNLPSTLKLSPRTISVTQKPPVPLPRTSLSPCSFKQSMENILDALAIEAKKSSQQLDKDLQQLHKETRSPTMNIVPKMVKDEQKMLQMDKQIDEVSRAAKLCEDFLKDVVPTHFNQPQPKPRHMEKRNDMLKDISNVSDAASECEQVLEAVFKVNIAPKSSEAKVNVTKKKENLPIERTSPLSVSMLLGSLQPDGKKLTEITDRCLKQIDTLASDMHAVATEPVAKTRSSEVRTTPVVNKSLNEDHDYDNLRSDIMMAIADDQHDYANISDNKFKPHDNVELCNNKSETSVTATVSHPSSVSLPKSTTTNRQASQSPLQNNVRAASHGGETTTAPSFSTTTTESPSFTCSPSPPSALTPLIGDESQYNSSEELAMIFGVDSPTNASHVTPGNSQRSSACIDDDDDDDATSYALAIKKHGCYKKQQCERMHLFGTLLQHHCVQMASHDNTIMPSLCDECQCLNNNNTNNNNNNNYNNNNNSLNMNHNTTTSHSLICQDDELEHFCEKEPNSDSGNVSLTNFPLCNNTKTVHPLIELNYCDKYPFSSQIEIRITPAEDDDVDVVAVVAAVECVVGDHLQTDDDAITADGGNLNSCQMNDVDASEDVTAAASPAVHIIHNTNNPCTDNHASEYCFIEATLRLAVVCYHALFCHQHGKFVAMLIAIVSLIAYFLR